MAEKLVIIGKYFPDFAEWLKKAAQMSPEYVRVMESELREIPESAIRKACEKIIRDGDTVRWQRLPAEVCRRAKRIVSRAELAKWRSIAGGDDVVSCRLCEDTGYVDVLDPKTVADVLRSRQLPAFPYTACVACTCAKGQLIVERDRQAEPRFRRNIATYDPKQHVRREVGVLPMDQYRELLQMEVQTDRPFADWKTAIRELANQTRVLEDAHPF